MKQCRACGETKPITEFYKDAHKTDGLSVTCRPCFRAKKAEYQMRPPRHPAPEGMKRCTLCKETRPVAEFSRNKNFYDGLHSACKTCAGAKFARWYAEADKTKLNENQKRRYRENPDRYADYELKAHYGLPHGSYEKMLAAQGGQCAICRASEPGGRAKRFHVDHCHATGCIRSLLCEGCNQGLGKFRDKPDLLRAAADYLDGHSK